MGQRIHSTRSAWSHWDLYSSSQTCDSEKVLLASAISIMKWEPIQLDVNNTFLNGDFVEEVYMNLPLGYKQWKVAKKGKYLVCRSHKSIYGLKQVYLDNGLISFLILFYLLASSHSPNLTILYLPMAVIRLF